MIHARRRAVLFAGNSRRTGLLEINSVVDFTREKPIDVPSLAVLVNVNPVTVRRWFRRGLDFCKLGGKVVTTLEALNRFQQGGNSAPVVQAVVVDRETLAALKSLKSRGIVFSSEAVRDGDKTKTAVGR